MESKRPKISVTDVLTFGGLAMAGTGLWLVRPWVALVVVGGVLFGMGLWSGLARSG